MQSHQQQYRASTIKKVQSLDCGHVPNDVAQITKWQSGEMAKLRNNEVAM